MLLADAANVVVNNTVAVDAVGWTFLAPFTIFWWIWVVLMSIWIITSLENEKYWGITGCFIVTLLAFHFLGGVNVGRWVMDNPLNTLWLFLGYFGLGAVYSILKWVLFTTGRRKEYEELKKKWLKDKGIDGNVVDDSLKPEWKKYLLSLSDYDVHHRRHKWWVYTGVKRDDKKVRIQPVALEYKSRITAWVVVWPWSAFWTMFDDVIVRIGEAIQSCLGGMMDAISKWSFKGVDEDF